MNCITALSPGLSNRNPAQAMTKYLQLTMSIETENCSSQCLARRCVGQFVRHAQD